MWIVVAAVSVYLIACRFYARFIATRVLALDPARPTPAPRRLLDRAAEAARLMVGVPRYDAYRRHMAARHPDRPAMSEVEFFRNRQEARYGGQSGGRCC